MKTINTYISEKLVIGNNLYQEYNYYPETPRELIDCITEKIEQYGLGTKSKPLDLNDIDTSEITSMGNLFNCNNIIYGLSVNGYFDISKWDVSNVKDMRGMFYGSSFDGDLSKWNVSHVENMLNMFGYSKFTGKNGDISKWNVSNVRNMESMFEKSWFEGDISKWNVSNVENMRYMFFNCYNFNTNLSSWKVSKVKNMDHMFDNSYLLKRNNKIPTWYN